MGDVFNRQKIKYLMIWDILALPIEDIIYSINIIFAFQVCLITCQSTFLPPHCLPIDLFHSASITAAVFNPLMHVLMQA